MIAANTLENTRIFIYLREALEEQINTQINIFARF